MNPSPANGALIALGRLLSTPTRFEWGEFEGDDQTDWCHAELTLRIRGAAEGDAIDVPTMDVGGLQLDPRAWPHVRRSLLPLAGLLCVADIETADGASREALTVLSQRIGMLRRYAFEFWQSSGRDIFSVEQIESFGSGGVALVRAVTQQADALAAALNGLDPADLAGIDDKAFQWMMGAAQGIAERFALAQIHRLCALPCFVRRLDSGEGPVRYSIRYATASDWIDLPYRGESMTAEDLEALAPLMGVTSERRADTTAPDPAFDLMDRLTQMVAALDRLPPSDRDLRIDPHLLPSAQCIVADQPNALALP